ncbi:MAG: hypothetical protein QOF23_406, partial [Solirubrobacterales bacterium]|nr:hypothetical protein [Solirubrobacterales bacterium]
SFEHDADAAEVEAEPKPQLTLRLPG